MVASYLRSEVEGKIKEDFGFVPSFLAGISNELLDYKWEWAWQTKCR